MGSPARWHNRDVGTGPTATAIEAFAAYESGRPK
jgi:hypothetical protein